MKYNNEKFHRRSNRLKRHDYAEVGAYFITICTFNKECTLGHITKGQMLLNDLGNTVKQEIIKTGRCRKNVRIDEYIIMPNHIHIIIIIQRRGTACRALLI